MPRELSFAVALPRPLAAPLDGGGLLLAAPAKINLNLLVGGKREDGYHPLDSFVAKVTLYDEIDLRPRGDRLITFRCGSGDCGLDEKNLALRAARLLAAGRDVPGVDIALRKATPVGKGLGGGSSDAATVLAGLNQLWQLGLTVAHLAGLALQLGSDVPLFLGPPAARMTGRGETLESARIHTFVAVLVLPNFSCATADVYRAFDDRPAEACEQLPAGDLAGPPSLWRGRLVNQLLPAAERVQPRLANLRRRIAAAISLPLSLTGSGSAMFVLCDDAQEAAAVLAEVPEDLRPLCICVQQSPT